MALSRVLVANRGEIAVRVIRACKALGIESVAAFSEGDRESLPVQLADHAVCIGPARSGLSYLNIEAVLATAKGVGADAVHPGYGFLSENPLLAGSCEREGIKFVGPSSLSMRQMGNKLAARDLAAKAGVPIVPGSPRVGSYEEAELVLEEIGAPVLFKAAAGGGGKGIRIVNDAKELRSTFESATAEARAAFGDSTLYMERYVSNARHIEVQVFGDGHGNIIHMGERDCSLQRRYQKIVEEAPAVQVPTEIRESIRRSGVLLATNIGYENAGTVEFIYDEDRQEYYFLEMNTRIQVEHPVTEEVTGLDLVRLQLQVAAGEPLGMSQEDVRLQGHSIECRITAESPANGFRPSPGLISEWSPPTKAGVRLDTHCYKGYTVPPFYDSMLAKLITHGEDRAEAVARMQDALHDFDVQGIDTSISFLSFLVGHPEYQAGNVNTRWVESQMGDFVRA